MILDPDLDAFRDVDNQQHHVYDLGSTNDCPYEGCMARAVYQGHLCVKSMLTSRC